MAGDHEITLIRTLLGKRVEGRVLKLDDLAKVPTGDILKIDAVTPPPFPKPEPPMPDESTEAALAEELTQAHNKWAEEKAAFDAMHPTDDLRLVAMWAPVFHIVKAMMDGMPLKIMHTLRGPVMGAVRNEDTNRAMLYSPCLIDPNIEKGRVHYIPMAFCGLDFIVYKNVCIGESIPQLAEIMGYPDFVNANRKGDYQFRMRAAYHHIEADMSENAPLHSVSQDVRQHEMGLVPTSDTREIRAIEKARQIEELQKQQAQSPTQ